ncbi:hypothetical protein L7F22_017822 [Adiantum nelumboides]|nr:hypothetical protein [Adiantum nelumboides]
MACCNFDFCKIKESIGGGDRNTIHARRNVDLHCEIWVKWPSLAAGKDVFVGQRVALSSFRKNPCILRSLLSLSVACVWDHYRKACCCLCCSALAEKDAASAVANAKLLYNQMQAERNSEDTNQSPQCNRRKCKKDTEERDGRKCEKWRYTQI